jgi:hypothetical protein
MRKADSLGMGVIRLIRNSLRMPPGANNAEASIAEFKLLSGKGNSPGWRRRVKAFPVSSR